MSEQQSKPFIVMTDEHVANAVVEQLKQKGVQAVRLIDHLPSGTPDPEVLTFCHENGYTLITLDKRIRGHLQIRAQAGLPHAGVFIGSEDLQGSRGIGTIVNFVVFYHDAIMAGAATWADDVYNRVITMTKET